MYIRHIRKVDKAGADRNLITSITQVSYNGQHVGATLDMDRVTEAWHQHYNYQGKNDYIRFDVRFNMSLRDTVFKENNTYLDKDVQEDYANLITIDGKTVKKLNSTDENSVIMDYDVINNILNVYVKKDVFDTNSNHEVIISGELSSDGGAELKKEVKYLYNAFDKMWERQNAPVSFFTRYAQAIYTVIYIMVIMGIILVTFFDVKRIQKNHK